MAVTKSSASFAAHCSLNASGYLLMPIARTKSLDWVAACCSPRHLSRNVAGSLAAKRFSTIKETSQSRAGILTRISRLSVEADSMVRLRGTSAGRPSINTRTSVNGSPDGARTS